MDAKLKIDIMQGILEVEGSEKFVLEVYEDYKAKLSSLQSKNEPAGISHLPDVSDGTKTRKQTDRKSKRKQSSPTRTPNLVKDLDLSGNGKTFSLNEFVKKYTPKSGFERNALFVYYLIKILEKEPIGIDHIYTCYKHLKVKYPNNLYQNLIDTKGKKGYIGIGTIDDITLTMIGENFIEHELSRSDQSPESKS